MIKPLNGKVAFYLHQKTGITPSIFRLLSRRKQFFGNCHIDTGVNLSITGKIIPLFQSLIRAIKFVVQSATNNTTFCI